MRTDAQSNGKPCRIIKGMVKDNVVYRKDDCMELVARHHGELGLERGLQNTQCTATGSGFRVCGVCGVCIGLGRAWTHGKSMNICFGFKAPG